MGMFSGGSLFNAAKNPIKHASSDDSFMGLMGGQQQADEAGILAAEEEARKAALRRRIDLFYGIGDDPEALAARTSLEGEKTKIADATRSYYTDQLGKDYEKAERKTRFALARSGVLGGSQDVEQQGEVRSDRDLGATRVDDAVRRALAGLETQREQERLSSIQLVNSGAGESAVSAAQAGLRNTLENASSAQKQDLFSDLFANSANAVSNANMADREAALLGRYKDRLSSFFPAKSATTGRVTPSA